MLKDIKSHKLRQIEDLSQGLPDPKACALIELNGYGQIKTAGEAYFVSVSTQARA